MIAITCGHPGNPTFGLTQGTQFNLNDAVRFVCNTGYVLQGKGKSSCQANGQWSNALPRCKSKRAIAFFLFFSLSTRVRVRAGIPRKPSDRNLKLTPPVVCSCLTVLSPVCALCMFHVSYAFAFVKGTSHGNRLCAK